MANPTWFDAKVYMANKLAQLQATDPKGNWTAESLTKVMEENGFKGDEGAYAHFTQFGEAENVSPNAMFDVAEYLKDKADQLNALKIDGKTTWDPAAVMDAIKAAGMNSAWEHYVKFGSAEGINPSDEFDTAGYIIAKTQLMNETSEGGRSNWTFAEVEAAFAENGLSALEHYNLFGQAEFKAAGKEDVLAEAIKVDEPVGKDPDFDVYTGVKTYENVKTAIAAKVDGTLASKYGFKTVEASIDGITVAEQKVMADVLSGATPASTATPKYSITDTVAALNDGAQIVLGATSYNVADTLLNVAQGSDSLVNNAAAATAKVAFTAKAFEADGTTATKATVTTVKYDDIDGKVGTDGQGSITLEKADDKAEGKAELVIDATATATALGKAVDAFDVDDANNAFTSSTLEGLSYKFIATANDDFLTVNGKEISVVDAGAGNDNVNSTLASGSEPTTALTLIGNDGSDILRGSSAADTIYAGKIAGTDATTTSVGRYSSTDTFIQDTAYKIALKGNDFVNYINGWKGDDKLYASDKADSFEYHQGKAASDNSGNTVENYATVKFADQGTDTIFNFKIGQDTLFINLNEENGYTGAAHSNGVIDILMKGDLATTAGEKAVTAVVTALQANAANGIDGVNDYQVVFTFGTGDGADTLTINLVDVQGVASGATLGAADLLLY